MFINSSKYEEMGAAYMDARKKIENVPVSFESKE